MNNEDFDLLENYLDNHLGQAQKEAVESRLKSDADFHALHKYLINAKGIIEAEQDLEFLEIMQSVDAERENSTESTTNNKPLTKNQKFNKAWLVAILIAAALVIGMTILKQTSDIDQTQIASTFALDENGFAVRGPSTVNEDSLIEITYTIPMQEISLHIKKGELSDAKNKLSNLKPDFQLGEQNVEYTSALISYLENGRSDETFQKILNKILDDPTHNCYPLAVRLDNEVNSIWGRIKG